MELIRGIEHLRERHKKSVLSIGNFDGVHLGHQSLLKKLKQEGARRNCPVMVMLFEPQPQEYFAPNKAPARLTRLRDKVRELSALGIDYLLCVNFDAAFAAMSAKQFVEQLLMDKLAITFLAVGDDFHFGADRTGDITLLHQLSMGQFTTQSSASFMTPQGQRISSTLIRQALANDDLAQAELMLGRPYSLQGRVRHGNALGRTLGFPTMNLSLNGIKAAISGVYAVEVANIRQEVIPGIANIGIRPTINGSEPQLEVHLLDFQQDLYGQHPEVIFRKKLRSEQRFASLQHLKDQIMQDELAARDFFALQH